MNWFQGCSTVGQVKSLFRKLAKEHHPDIGGDTRTMQDIVGAYHSILERMHGQSSTGTDGKEHTYYYSQAREAALVAMVEKVVGLNLPGVTVEIVGSWLWVSGDTKPHRQKLGSVKRGGVGLRWHSKRSMWYWRPRGKKATYSRKDFDTIRQYYGSEVVSAGASEESAPAAGQVRLGV